MKKVFSIALLLFVFISCDKPERYAARMDGTWTVERYTRITGAGFHTEYPAEGTITFSDLGDSKLSYSEDFSFNDGTNWIDLNRTGNMKIVGDKVKSFELDFTNLAVSSTTHNFIHVISKDDLKIEFQNNGIGHLLVLKKQD